MLVNEGGCCASDLGFSVLEYVLGRDFGVFVPVTPSGPSAAPPAGRGNGWLLEKVVLRTAFWTRRKAC